MYEMFVLTPMTGKGANATRTVIFAGFEVNQRNLLVGLAASPIGLLFTAIFWPLLGSGSLLFIFVAIGVALFVVNKRTNDGLKLRVYQAMLDKRKTTFDEFYICGIPMLAQEEPISVMANTVLAEKPRTLPKPAAAPDLVSEGEFE